jgi:phosphoglycolate phosphatase-like HAD superfamily hydrolase
MSDHVEGAVPRVAVFDIDGVLADVRHRLHFLDARPRDWDAFFAAVGADAVLTQGVDAIRDALADGLGVVYLTGRPERCRQDTVQWLHAHGLPVAEVLMRPDAERRPARLFKVAALRRLASHADVAYLVDDDPEVADAVSAAGVPVRLADWMARTGALDVALEQAQETLGRT